MPMTQGERDFAPAWLQDELSLADSQETGVTSPWVSPKSTTTSGRGIIASLVLACLLSEEPISRRKAMTLWLWGK